MLDKEKERIKSLLEAPLKKEGCDIVDLVLSKYKSNVTVRLFIYAKDRTSLNECARVSRIIGNILDETEMYENGYSLEVSSPGLDRLLTTLKDFDYRVGEKVNLYINDSQKEILAEIVGTGDEEVTFENEDGRFTFEMAKISKAKIIY